MENSYSGGALRDYNPKSKQQFVARCPYLAENSQVQLGHTYQVSAYQLRTHRPDGVVPARD